MGTPQPGPAVPERRASLPVISGVAAICAGILGAPCAVTLLVAPLGLGGVVAAMGGMWFDQNRIWFMLAALALVLLTHRVYRRVRALKATMAGRVGASFSESVWEKRIPRIATAVTLAFIVMELIADPLL